MDAIDVRNLSYAYGRVRALDDLTFSVPEGALYALLGPNGSGKTTLMQILTGLRRPQRGHVALLGVDARALTVAHRQRIGYVAEGQPLPAWMTLRELERYLAPLYPEWDLALAQQLRERFALDPRRRVGTLSRGEHMKAALLCALAPRPRLLLMDEPFTGMDALVKDDLVRGLLATAGQEGWTVLVASHDIGEVELLADWVGILERGRMRVSEPMDRLRERFRRVTVTFADAYAAARQRVDSSWIAVERAGMRLTFMIQNGNEDSGALVRNAIPGALEVEVQEASLREIFVALARDGARTTQAEVAA